MAEAADPLPDERRCKRTDGRDWRCKRPVKEGKLLCEIHFAQVRLRNGRIKVPEALKLQRSNRTSTNIPPHPQSSDGGIRVNGREHLERNSKRKRPDSDDLTEETAERKAEEVLNALAKAKKHKEKKKIKKKEKNAVPMAGEQRGVEITRELPYGRMAIAPLPEYAKASVNKPIGNAAPSPPVKLGLESPNYRLVNRKFRSKNVEQPPVSTSKAVPFARNRKKKDAVKTGRRKCHWCQKARNVSLNECLSCKKRFFCSVCIEERSIEAQEIKLKCPVCLKTCRCHACLANHPKDANSEDMLRKQCKSNRYLSLRYMISLVLPILEQINDEQRIELETEAQLKEQSLSEVEVQQAEIPEEQICCNKCSSLILDMHRSCPNCLYNLCLSCCQETRDLMIQDAPSHSRKNSQKRKQVAKSSVQSVGNLDNCSVGNLICPSLESDECSSRSSVLDLRCVFPLNYTRDLEISAKEIILSDESPKFLDPSLSCSLCSSMAGEGNKNELLEASERKHLGDNFLYCPSIRGDYEILLVHFQKHWRNCHPIIFRDLLEKSSDLNWDPLVMFCNYLNMELSRCANDKEETGVTNCKDWYKVEFCSKENFKGVPNKLVHSRAERLRLNAKLSSVLSESVFSAESEKILNKLPIQEYTNPSSGLLNLSAKFCPHVHITCSDSEEVQKGELVHALCYQSHDLVNVLVHASDLSSSTDQVDKIKILVRRKNIKDIGRSNCLDLNNVKLAVENPSAGQLKNSTAKASSSETESDTSLKCTGGANANYNPGKNTSELFVADSALADSSKASSSATESDTSLKCIRGTNDNPEKDTSEMFVVDSPLADSSAPEKESSEERPCGIQWDVFRRQDTPKILEYVQRHSDEFYDLCGKAIDPILDGNIFLDSAHKLMLKNEFKIEPWTFDQKLGEAVLIPTGCLYQMKNLKSCINVVLGFVSPENAGECIKLADKLQDLPTNNTPKASKVEVQKMIINKISKAIEEMRKEPRTQSS